MAPVVQGATYNPPAVPYKAHGGVGQWRPVIDAASKATGVPAAILEGVMYAESNGDHTSVSPVGALGLMQLMPDTAKDLGVNPHDPYQNILGGAKYLRDQYAQFHDWRKAVAAYNAGPGAVMKYGGIPPYKETQAYVKRIEDYVNSQGRR